MKLKKYKVLSNPNNYTFVSGDALGCERFGFKNYSAIHLLDKDLYTDDYCCYFFNSSDCVEVPDNEEMPVSTSPSLSNSNSNLLTSIGEKPSKITIEF